MINFQSNPNFQFSNCLKILVVVLSFSFFVFSFVPVFAGNLVPCGGTGQSPCEIINIFQLIKNVINWLVWYGGIFATLFIAGAGIMMLISRGNEARITKARLWITNAVIGLLLIFIAWLIINTIFFVLGFPGPEFTWPTGIQWGTPKP